MLLTLVASQNVPSTSAPFSQRLRTRSQSRAAVGSYRIALIDPRLSLGSYQETICVSQCRVRTAWGYLSYLQKASVAWGVSEVLRATRPLFRVCGRRAGQGTAALHLGSDYSHRRPSKKSAWMGVGRPRGDRWSLSSSSSRRPVNERRAG